MMSYFQVCGFDDLAALCRHNDPIGTGLRIDLGCGFYKPSGFIGIDSHLATGIQIRNEQNMPDIVMDLNAHPLPFPDDSCAEVRSSHFLEHSHLDHIITQTFRVLKPGGFFTFIVPYANSAEGMYPGHAIFLTEKFFHNNPTFGKHFEILEERYKPSADYTALPNPIKELFPFEIARKMLFNACCEMTILCMPRK